mgnify:CR=1 FL=1
MHMIQPHALQVINLVDNQDGIGQVKTALQDHSVVEESVVAFLEAVADVARGIDLLGAR